MGSPGGADQVAVSGSTESGGLCTVTVLRDPRGRHQLRYEGTETVVAALTPEVTELLTAALSKRGRSAVSARCLVGGACTLLVLGHRDGRVTVYFHAAPATSVVLDAAGTTTLRAALDSLAANGQTAG